MASGWSLPRGCEYYSSCDSALVRREPKEAIRAHAIEVREYSSYEPGSILRQMDNARSLEYYYNNREARKAYAREYQRKKREAKKHTR